MLLDTAVGPVDDAELDSTDAVVDDERRYWLFTEYRRRGTDEVVLRSKARVAFNKVNFFLTNVPAVVNADMDGTGELTPVLTVELDRRLGQDDDADAFTCWIEYVRRDTGRVVKRVERVYEKVKPGAAGDVGG